MASHAQPKGWIVRETGGRKASHRVQVSASKQAGKVVVWTFALMLCAIMFIFLVMVAAGAVLAIQQGGTP